MRKLLFLSGLLMLSVSVCQSASFVKNPEDVARIEAALPSSAYAKPAKARRLLIFTLNVGYGGHPSMAYANEAFTLMGRKTGAFETVVTDDPKIFERESLRTFDAVFFNNTVGNCFTNAEWRRNLVEFVLGGGGLLGVHGSTVAFTQWPGAIEDWPEFGYMIGARGANHKDSDEHIWMKPDDPENPIVKVFGGQDFDFRDEFFRPQGTYSRQRVRVVLSIDTAKCDPDKGQARGDCFRPDHDYAVAWIRNYGKGHVFYCTIAHNPYVFWDEKMLSFYLAALQFALGDLPCPTTPSAKLTPAIRVQEKLGWSLAFEPQTATLTEAADQASKMGRPWIIGTAGQQVGAHLLRPLDPGLSDAELEQVRLKMEAASVRLLACHIGEAPQDEAKARKLLEFGPKLGLEMLICDSPPDSIPFWAEQARKHDLKVAFRARAPSDIAALAKGGKEPGSRLGIALDLSDKAWLERNPARTVGSLGSSLLYVRLPDASAKSERVAQWLSQIRAAGAKPVFSGVSEASLQAFDAASLKLDRP